MLRIIDHVEDLNDAIENLSGIVCLFFVTKKSNPSNAFEPILKSVCDDFSIPVLKLFCDNPNLFNVVGKYGVGPIPGYVFVKDDKIVYKSYGLIPRQTLKEIVKKIGDGVWTLKNYC